MVCCVSIGLWIMSVSLVFRYVECGLRFSELIMRICWLIMYVFVCRFVCECELNSCVGCWFGCDLNLYSLMLCCSNGM